MKQILINITKNDDNEPTMIINCINDDDTTFKKVIVPAQMTEKEVKFLQDIGVAIDNYKK